MTAHRTDIPHEPGTLDSCWGCKPPVPVQQAEKPQQRIFETGDEVMAGPNFAVIVRRTRRHGQDGYDVLMPTDLGEPGQYSHFYPDHMVHERPER